MTPEERERTIDFILQQQAQFEINLQRQQEQSKQMGGAVLRLERNFVKLTELAELQSNRMDHYEEWQKRSFQKMDHVLDKLDQILDRLTS